MAATTTVAGLKFVAELPRHTWLPGALSGQHVYGLRAARRALRGVKEARRVVRFSLDPLGDVTVMDLSFQNGGWVGFTGIFVHSTYGFLYKGCRRPL